MSGQGGQTNPDEDVTVTKRWKTGMIITVVVLTLVVVGLLAYIFFGHHITPVIQQHLGKQINAVQTKWDSTVGQKWRDVTGLTAAQQAAAEAQAASEAQIAAQRQQIAQLRQQSPAFLQQQAQIAAQQEQALKDSFAKQEQTLAVQKANVAAALQQQARQQQAAIAATQQLAGVPQQDNRSFLQRWNPWG